MSDTHILYKGSDIHLPGFLTNPDDSPMNLTGATVTLRTAAALTATVTVINALGGEILISAPWSEDWKDGRVMWLRVVVDPGVSQGFPPVWFDIK